MPLLKDILLRLAVVLEELQLRNLLIKIQLKHPSLLKVKKASMLAWLTETTLRKEEEITSIMNNIREEKSLMMKEVL